MDKRSNKREKVGEERVGEGVKEWVREGKGQGRDGGWGEGNTALECRTPSRSQTRRSQRPPGQGFLSM